VSFYEKIILLHFFATNNAFFNNNLSKTYFKISHSILYLIELEDSRSIDSFFTFFSKIIEAGEESKLTILILDSNLIKKSASFKINSKEIKASRKNVNNSNKKINSLIMTDNYESKVNKLNGLIKIYKIVALYVKDLSEVSVSNPTFLNFIGYLLLNKMRISSHRSNLSKATQFKKEQRKADVNHFSNDKLSYILNCPEKNDISDLDYKSNYKLFKRTYSFKG
jgi:hypothetical protein